MAKHWERQGNHIVHLNYPAYDFYVDSTVDWVRHLGEKYWVTDESLAELQALLEGAKP